MIKLNIHEAKTHLSAYLERVARGETIVLCRRNVPVAEIRAVRSELKTRRAIGLGRGTAKIPKSFFDPLPEETVASFEGKAG